MSQFVPHNDGFSARDHADCWKFVNRRDRALRDSRIRCGETRRGNRRINSGQRISWDRRGVRTCLPPL